MTWTSEANGKVHELWVRPRFADGVVGTGGSTVRDGVEMAGVGDDDWRPAAGVVAWDLVCDCGVLSSSQESWVLNQFWTRVPSRALEDLEAGKVFADDDETLDLAYLREDVSDRARAAWNRHHIMPMSADDAVRNALAAYSQARESLDLAVLRARQAGRTWLQIGTAAGMSAPAANSRWKLRIEALEVNLKEEEEAERFIHHPSPASAGPSAHTLDETDDQGQRD